MADTAYPFDPAKTRSGYGAIDIVVNMYTPDIIAEGRAPTDENFRDKVKVQQGHRARTNARAIHREDGPFWN